MLLLGKFKHGILRKCYWGIGWINSRLEIIGMKKSMLFAVVSGFLFFAISHFVQAQDDVAGPFKFSVGADASFTDNRDSTAKGLEEDNTDLYIRGKVDAIFDWGDSILDFFIEPSYRYRSNPDDFQKENKLFWDIGVHGRHALSDRVNVRMKEKFRSTDDPTLSDGGVNVTREGTYFLNNLSGGLGVDVARKSRLDFDATWVVKEYDEDVFEYLHEDSLDGHLAFRQQLSRTVVAVVQGKARQFGYGDITAVPGAPSEAIMGSNRDFDSVSGGVGLENQFRVDSRLSAYVGYINIDFAEDEMPDDDSPYAGLILDHQANAATKLTLAGMYGLRETAVRRYSVQNYSDIRGDIHVDLNKSFTLGLGGIYRYSKYNADGITPAGRQFSIDNGLELDGNQTTMIGFGSVAYNITEDAVLKFLYRYTTDDSDVSVDFDKNEAVLSFVQNF